MDGVVVGEVDVRGVVVRLALDLWIAVGDAGVVACGGSWLDVGVDSSVSVCTKRGFYCWSCDGRMCCILRVVVV